MFLGEREQGEAEWSQQMTPEEEGYGQQLHVQVKAGDKGCPPGLSCNQCSSASLPVTQAVVLTVPQ